MPLTLPFLLPLFSQIHLMLGIAIRKESSYGVSEVNGNVNLIEFFLTQVFPELQDSNHTHRPMVKATALSFVCTFRNQFSREQLLQLLPLLITHLGSTLVVVHTLAANTIERILWTKEKDSNGLSREKLARADLQPFLQNLFTALFYVVENIALNENEYVMKCIMRTLDRAGDDVIPVTNVVFDKLFPALERVCKNPRNPGFNHNLFESIALLVKNLCSKDPLQVGALENRVFPPFQTILQMDVLEFSPYVFQIMAQLLEYKPPGTPMGDAYRTLLPGLLHPSSWEKRGNVPALARLLSDYMKLAGTELVTEGKLVPMLGIFQKLNAVTATDTSAFEVLTAITTYAPQGALTQHFKTVFQLIMTKLGGKPGNRYPILASQFFALFCGRFGGRLFVDILDQIQPGVASGLVAGIWAPKVSGAAAGTILAKSQIVGATRLLHEAPLFLSNAAGKEAWTKLLGGVVIVVTSSTFTSNQDLGVFEDETPVAYDATFSQLRYAKKIQDDPFASVADPVAAFGAAITALSQEHPGVLGPTIQQGLGSDPKLLGAFQNLCQTKGINIA